MNKLILLAIHIMKNAIPNEPAFFENLFKQYYVELCEYSRGIIGDKYVAEDIVQDAFLYLWNHRHQISIKTSLKAYLYTAVRHGSLNHLKRQVTEEKHTPRLTEFITYLQESEYSEEESEKLRQAKLFLKELPEQCRIVFLKNCLEGKKYKDIATELDISVNTVKTHLSKAYRLLRERFKINPILFLFIKNIS